MKIFKTWTFKWWEVALLKLSLISFGIILALYFYDYFIDLMWLWWTVFIISTLNFLPSIFTEE
jgi:hypothetical protein